MQAHDEPELRRQVREQLLYPTKPRWQDDAVRLRREGASWSVIANRCNVSIVQAVFAVARATNAEVA